MVEVFGSWYRPIMAIIKAGTASDPYKPETGTENSHHYKIISMGIEMANKRTYNGKKFRFVARTYKLLRMTV